VNSDELATARWFKSSRSNGEGNCVEVAFLSSERVGVRDSKDKGAGPAHVFTRAAWLAFVEATKDGEFDRSARR
jgi:hypothetical protein